MGSKQPSAMPLPPDTERCAGCNTKSDLPWDCKTCSKSLCNKCKEKHILSKHKVVPNADDRASSRNSSIFQESKPCPQHPDSEIKVYCNDCGFGCCLSCIHHSHRRHDIVPIQQKYEECEEKLNAVASEWQTRTLTNLQTNIEDLRNVLKTSEKKFVDAENEVNKQRQILKDSVDKSCNELVQDLKQKKTLLTTSLTTAIKSLENQIQENENLIDECGQKIREGGLDFLNFDLPSPRVKPIPDLVIPIPVFVHGKEVTDLAMQKKVGRVEYKKAEYRIGKKVAIKTRKVESEVAEQEKQVVETSPKPEGEMRDFEEGISGESVAPAGKGSAWVAHWGSGTMHLYDAGGRKVRSVTVKTARGLVNKRECSILDLAVTQSGDVLVSHWDEKIRQVTVSDTVDILIDTAPFTPRAIGLTGKEEVVVCMVQPKEMFNNRLTVFSRDGKRKVRETIVKDEQGKQLLTDPKRVVMSGKEQISVMNDERNVVTTDMSGNFCWMYDGSNAALGKRFRPRGMCGDKYLNLLISDGNNNCVHHVGKDGGLIRILLNKEQHGIERPLGIAVDNGEGKVWVGSAIGYWVLKYPE